MKIKQGRSTRLANQLFQLLEEGGRNFDTVVAHMITNTGAFGAGYEIYEKHNDKTILFYGHINFDKVKVVFERNGKEYVTQDLNKARELIIAYLYMDDSYELLTNILKN